MLDIITFIIIGIFFGICVGVTLSNNYIFSKLNLRKTSAQICLGSLLSTIIFGWLEYITRNPYLDYPFKESYLNQVYKFGYKSCATAVRGCHISQSNGLKSTNIALRRDVVVFKEPLNFVKYFLSKAQKQATQNNTYWINNL